VCVVLSLVVTGCGARSVPLAQPRGPDAERASASGPAAPAAASLSEFITKVRALAAEARPPDRAPVVHAEASDPRLAGAVAAARVHPAPETHRLAAEEYRRLGIADRAYDYLQRALRLDAGDAATYDALARLWRDGGLPGLALADAHRAVYYAPWSPIARNTLGTVFQALGRRAEARTQYERALDLDPAAAYALNNLCYGWILDRQPDKAVSACRAALAIEPVLPAARNNLGLAHVALGELDAARAAFDGVGDRATVLYNLGIVHMARRRYPDAVSAFAAAQQARPVFPMAVARAEQAGRLALAGAGE
jgi:tetratricopeptide (TPR) repeat protein